MSWLFAIGGVDTIDVHADASTIPPGAPATLAEGRPWTRPRALAEWIASLDLSVFTLIAALTVVYIIIGCFLDGISAVVLTMAVVEPMVNIPAFREVGFTMIWLGIFVTVVAEMAQITPPIGFDLFVLQGMTRHEMSYIAKTALPMFLIMVVILVLSPELGHVAAGDRAAGSGGMRRYARTGSRVRPSGKYIRIGNQRQNVPVCHRSPLGGARFAWLLGASRRHSGSLCPLYRTQYRINDA